MVKKQQVFIQDRLGGREDEGKLMPFMLVTERQDSSIDFAGKNSKKYRHSTILEKWEKCDGKDAAVQQSTSIILTPFEGDAKGAVITKPSVKTQKL